MRGGVRSRLGTCFTAGEIDAYRPIYWFNDETKRQYEELFGIIHSDCYTRYGFKRTGCAGCPFNRELAADLVRMEANEPKLAKAAKSVFADSYEYTSQYKAFVSAMGGQTRLDL